MKSLGKVFLIMLSITVILLFLFALCVRKFYWENTMISFGISIIYLITCFAGGFLAGRVQKTKKYIWGILMSFAYILLVLVITQFVKQQFELSMSEFMTNLLLCSGSGMLGGMLS